MSKLPHLTPAGDAHMVDVGKKTTTLRRAVAQGFVRMSKAAFDAISAGRKGDALAVARVAGIMAAKRTSDLIPLCHPIALSGIQVELTPEPGAGRVFVQATVEALDRTGVEMEALTAVSVASLTLYDMLKSVDRRMEIGGIGLLYKEGGRSGPWRRPVKVVAKMATPPPRPERNDATSRIPRAMPVSSPPRRPIPVLSGRATRRATEVFAIEGDDPRLAAFLRAQPIDCAYMLGDLDPAYAEQCRWLALPGSAPESVAALLLFYGGLRVPVVLISGEPDDAEVLVHSAAAELPRRFHAQVRPHHLGALESIYTLPESESMIRMGLTRDDYIQAVTDAEVVSVGHRDTAAIMALYAHYPDNFFDPAQLDTGLYCGIRRGGELVSLAGIHVYSEAFDVAAIGNIVTHTEHRGQGLATRCVRRLLDRLFENVSNVALNVAVDNAPAIACYEKFGFTERFRFVEGWASR